MPEPRRQSRESAAGARLGTLLARDSPALMSVSKSGLVGSFVMLFALLMGVVAIGTLGWAVLPVPNSRTQAFVGLLWMCDTPQSGDLGCTIIHNDKKASPSKESFSLLQLHGGSVSSGGKAAFSFYMLALPAGLVSVIAGFPVGVRLYGATPKWIAIGGAVCFSFFSGLAWLLYASIVLHVNNTQLENVIGAFAPGYSFALTVLASVASFASAVLFLFA